MPVDSWYDIVAALHIMAANTDEAVYDEYADQIHDQLLEQENKGWWR